MSFEPQCVKCKKQLDRIVKYPFRSYYCTSCVEKLKQSDPERKCYLCSKSISLDTDINITQCLHGSQRRYFCENCECNKCSS